MGWFLREREEEIQGIADRDGRVSARGWFRPPGRIPSSGRKPAGCGTPGGGRSRSAKPPAFRLTPVDKGGARRPMGSHQRGRTFRNCARVRDCPPRPPPSPSFFAGRMAAWRAVSGWPLGRGRLQRRFRRRSCWASRPRCPMFCACGQAPGPDHPEKRPAGRGAATAPPPYPERTPHSMPAWESEQRERA